MTSPVKRAAAYIRLSRDTEASTSPVRQRADVERYIKAHEWELVEVIEDIDVSATKRRLDRPGIHRIRALFAADEVDIVVVSRLDRLARSVVDVSLLLEEGWDLASATESFDTSSPVGRAMIQVAQIFAEMEAATIRARIKSMRAHLPTVGRWPGGKTPYGYTTGPMPDGAGRTLVHDPDEAPVVRKMIEWTLAGVSLTQVATSLTMEGHLTRKGTPWSPATVSKILSRGTLRGWAKLHGEWVRDDVGLPAIMWPPLISAEEARVLDKALARNVKAARLPDTGRVPLLHGLAVCSGCRRLLTPRHFNHPTLAPLYMCSSRNKGHACDSPQTVTASRAEEEAAHQFLNGWGHLPVYETTEEEVGSEELHDVNEALVAASAEMLTTSDVMAVATRIERLRARKAELELLPRTQVTQRATGELYAEAWVRSTVRDRQELMRAAQAYVTVYPAKARGHFDAGRIVVSDELAGQLDEDGYAD